MSLVTASASTAPPHAPNKRKLSPKQLPSDAKPNQAPPSAAITAPEHAPPRRSKAKSRQAPPLSPPRRKSARRMRTSPVTPPPPSSVTSTPSFASTSSTPRTPPPPPPQPPAVVLTDGEAMTMGALDHAYIRSKSRTQRVINLLRGQRKAKVWNVYLSARASLVQTVVRACSTLRLGHDALHVTLALLDRLVASLLDRLDITVESHRPVLKSLASACALLAAKTQQTAAETPPLAHFAAVYHQANQSLARIELLALNSLAWQLDVVVAPHFLALFRNVATRVSKSQKPASPDTPPLTGSPKCRESVAFDVAHCALDLALYDAQLSSLHHPRLLAAAAWSAGRAHCALQPTWSPRMVAVSGVADAAPLWSLHGKLAKLLEGGWQ